MRLRRLVAVSITPAVLIVGVLALVVLHFHSTLLLAEQNDQLARGTIHYQADQLQVTFTRDAGGARPAISYGQAAMLQYVEWSSSVVVDGVVYSLWDQAHGYTFDDTHQQVYSTVSGPGWQIVQMTSLGSQGVTVSYSFVTLSSAAGGMIHQVALVLSHANSYWLAPQIRGDQFTGGVSALPVSAPQAGTAVQPSWRLTLTARPAAGTQSALALVNPRSVFIPAEGVTQTWASGLTSTYTFIDPQPNMLTPVATEHVVVAPVG